MKLKKAFVKIYQILVFGVPVLYLLFMIALGIMTQIAYSRFGVYPDAEMNSSVRLPAQITESS